MDILLDTTNKIIKASKSSSFPIEIYLNIYNKRKLKKEKDETRHTILFICLPVNNLISNYKAEQQ